MSTFAELAASRRDWIANVLRPWCAQAARVDLVNAEAEWDDIAGRVDAAATLWTWAWGRFPALVHEGLAGLNETHEVRVTLKDGRVVIGYPDNRQSRLGRLALIGVGSGSGAESDPGPISIDEIAAVERV